MPTTSSPLASDVLVNSLIKMEQDGLHLPPALQISPAAVPVSAAMSTMPHLLLSQQQPVIPPPQPPTVEAMVQGASGSADDDCKVKLEIDDLFPSVPAWDETSVSSVASSSAPPPFLTATMPPLSVASASTSTAVKTVKVPSLQHSVSVPADIEAALKLPQVPTSSSALNLNALRPQPPVIPVSAAALASAVGLRIAIPQSADTTTSAVGVGNGLVAPPTTPSPAGSSSIASPPMAGAAIATAASASSTTKKTVFTAKGKDRELGN